MLITLTRPLFNCFSKYLITSLHEQIKLLNSTNALIITLSCYSTKYTRTTHTTTFISLENKRLLKTTNLQLCLK